MNKVKFISFMNKCVKEQCQLDPPYTLLRDTEHNQIILMKEIQVFDQQQFQIIYNSLVKQKQLYHQHLISLIDFYAKNKKNIVAFYQYSSHNLFQQIEYRTEDNKSFAQQQLQNILVSVLKALDYLESEDVGHGCISPFDICFSQRLIKIVDPSIASSSPLVLNKGYYYSPEMLQNLCERNDNQIDIFKSDIFCLGLCILHCGLKQSCQDCYDYQQGQFFDDVLNQKINRFHQLYSQKLGKILFYMLEVDPQKRLTVKELFEEIELEFKNEEFQYQSERSFEEMNQSKSELNQFSYESEYGKKSIPFDKIGIMLASNQSNRLIENPIQKEQKNKMYKIGRKEESESQNQKWNKKMVKTNQMKNMGGNSEKKQFDFGIFTKQNKASNKILFK